MTSVGRPLAGRGGQVSADGRVAFATVQYDQPAFEISIGAVVILSLLFLMAVFRSLWVALVSAAFNVRRSPPPCLRSCSG